MEPEVLNFYEFSKNKEEEESKKVLGEPLAPVVPAMPLPEQPVDEQTNPIPVAQVYKPAKQEAGLTVEEVLSNPEELAKARRYMAKTRDIYYETAPDEKVMEDFMSAHRFIAANEVSTAKEFYNILAAPEEERQVYTEAHDLYSRMGSMFSNGDAWNGLVDYAQATASAPSTYLGFGVGKAVTWSATRAARAAALEAATNTATKSVIKNIGNKATAEVTSNQIKTAAVKTNAKYAISAQLASEMAVASVADAYYQGVMMETDLQDEFSYLQNIASGVLGGVTAIPGSAILARAPNTVASQTGVLIDKAFSERAKRAAKNAIPKIEKGIKEAQVDWLKLAEAGKGFRINEALENDILDWLFSPTRKNGLFATLREEGADLNLEKGTAAADLFRYVNGMGDEALELFNKALEPLRVTLGELAGIAGKAEMKAKTNLDLAMELAAGKSSRGGEVLNYISQMVRANNELKGLSVSKTHSQRKVVQNILDGVDELKPADKPEVFRYILDKWRGNITSTTMTTALNVAGWGYSKTMESLADIVRANAVLGKAGVKALLGKGSAADFARAKSLFENQAFVMQSLVDPYISAESFMTLVEKTAPTSVRKQLLTEFYGGVRKGGAEQYGLNPKNPLVRASEGYSNFWQKMSFARLADTLTKGVSGIDAMDKESRLAFGKGIYQLIKDGETYKLTPEIWETVTDRVLKEIASEDFSKGDFLLRPIASSIQQISNNPTMGYLLPFGKFVNFVAATTWRYSPMYLLNVGSHIFVRGKGFDGTAAQMLSKSVVGSSLILYAANRELDKQEEGLQWYQERTSEGYVENVSNIYPMSLFNLIGRVAANKWRGEGGNAALIEELKRQVTSVDALSDALSLDWLKPIADFMTDESVQVDGENVVLDGFLSGVASGAGLLGGHLRPFDAYSRFVDESLTGPGGAIAPDMKQVRNKGDRIVLEASRYISGFFNLAFGEENEYGKRMMAPPRESATSLGPVRQPDPLNNLFATKLEGPRSSMNVLLGMVDLPPYKADSFTSGNPEFDAMMNKHISSLLDVRAENMLKQEWFKKAPQSKKIDEVNRLINQTRDDLLSLFEGRLIGGNEDKLLIERGKFLTRSKSLRIRARKALGITSPDHKLSLYELESLQLYMAMEEKQSKKLMP